MTVGRSWHRLSITASPDAVEAIESAFNRLDALGTEQDHMRRRQDEPVTVSGYFETRPTEDGVVAALTEALQIYGLQQESVFEKRWSMIEEADWLAEWKKHWSPTVTGSFVVAAPWDTPSAPGKLVILIEPNMAFGTGTHETTRLCLAAIERNLRPNDSLLDVGTGTGVLAIAAVKLHHSISGKPASVLAYETDADSVVIAEQNAELNGVRENVSIRHGTISETTPEAELVCANLTLDVILPMLELLIMKTRRVLILSGILDEQRAAILTALSDHSFDNPAVEVSGEWISVTVEKPSTDLL